jgi:hypothetical protein
MIFRRHPRISPRRHEETHTHAPCSAARTRGVSGHRPGHPRPGGEDWLSGLIRTGVLHALSQWRTGLTRDPCIQTTGWHCGCSDVCHGASAAA